MSKLRTLVEQLQHHSSKQDHPQDDATNHIEVPFRGQAAHTEEQRHRCHPADGQHNPHEITIQQRLKHFFRVAVEGVVDGAHEVADDAGTHSEGEHGFVGEGLIVVVILNKIDTKHKST